MGRVSKYVAYDCAAEEKVYEIVGGWATRAAIL